MRVEPLEARRMLSASAPAVTDGILVVTGTARADRIVVSHDPHRGGALRVDLNGRHFWFRDSAVRQINVAAGNGDDLVRADNTYGDVRQPMLVLGGAGSDSLFGSVGNDTLDGGAGRDWVQGEGGADVYESRTSPDAGGTTTGGTTTGGTTTGGTVDPGPGATGFPGKANLFPVGVWYQPTNSFDKWQALGVNTLVGYESQGNSVSMSNWSAEAVRRGLYMIRQPSGNLAADKNQSNLLAWMLPDEPDLKNTSPAQLLNTYNALKRANPNLPVFENFSGGYVLNWQGRYTADNYKKWLASADWVSSDIYPVTGWGLPDKLGAPAQAVDRLSSLSNGKPQFAFIETSAQKLPWLPNAPGVTTGQFRGELWDAVLHGARGVVYFPQKIGGFQYDNTPPAVSAEMKLQNARLQDLAGPLLSPANPAGMGIDLPPGFEGCWRSYGGKSYFFVLNMGKKAVTGQTIQLHGVDGKTAADVRGEGRGAAIQNGSITDDFAPYQMHAYEVA